MVLLLSIVWVIAVGVMLLRALTQYRRYEGLRPLPWFDSKNAQTVTVIIPARNQAQSVAKCLEGLTRQDYPHYEIIVVDDGSTDDTADVVQIFRATDCRIRLIQVRGRPAGWGGKPYACQQGFLAAQGDWLCFMDADTESSPALLSSAITVAQQKSLDMLSLQPFQILGSFWERVIVPADFFLLTLCHDLRRVSGPQFCNAHVNGQFILIRRRTYQAVSQHTAVQTRVLDDSTLSRLIKSMGRSCAVLGAERLIRTRMCSGLESLWAGLTRNMAETAGSFKRAAFLSALALCTSWGSIAFPVLIYQAFLADSVVSGRDLAICAGAMAAAVLYAMHIRTVRYFGIPWWYGLLFPLGNITGALIILHGLLGTRNQPVWARRSVRTGKSDSAL